MKKCNLFKTVLVVISLLLFDFSVVSAQTFNVNVEVGLFETGIFCPDTTIVEGNVFYTSLAGNNSDINVSIESDPNSVCVFYTGLTVGLDTFWILLDSDVVGGPGFTTDTINLIVEVTVDLSDVNQVVGEVQYDNEGNNCSSNSISLSNFMVQMESNSNSFSTFSRSDGRYNLFANDEGDFTTSVILPDHLISDPPNHTHSFLGVGNSDTGDFCVSAIQSINDLAVSFLPLNEARPGFTSRYSLVYRNRGTMSVDGNVMLEYNNDLLTLLSANSSISNQTANTLTFDFTDLNPFEVREIDLKFEVAPPPTVNIDDILNFVATVNPISGDLTEDDNTSELSQTVIGAYDPNDIQVLEGPQVFLENADEFLHYIIRFQNTGTAEAINVRVENTLDNNLDWQSMQLETTSHDARVEIADGNQVAFIFDDILLPDSTSNEPESHGFIAYRIKPKSDIQLGDVVSNTASIFFDFNEPIITNTVTTTFVDETTNTSFINQESKFSIFPNPVTDILAIESESPIAKIEIFNRFGALVLTSFNINNIQLTGIPGGLYFCKLKDENGSERVVKFVKH